LSQVDRKMKKCFGEVIETPKGCTQFERNNVSLRKITRVKTQFCHRVSQGIFLERIIRLQLFTSNKMFWLQQQIGLLHANLSSSLSCQM